MKNNPVVLSLVSAAVLFLGPAASPVSAQLAAALPVAPAYQPLSDPQLDQLLGPIALYPDPLLAQILPAATLPTQVVLANRYVTGGGDPNLIEQQPWDPSVQALGHYPAVLQYLDYNLAWTTQVGLAFLYQQEQVMDSIQRLRLSAENFGNLVSTPQEQVVNDDGEIEILPVNPEVIYVPIYQPDYIYDQSNYGVTFGAGCVFGSWLNCDFNWRQHHLYYWDHNHPRPGDWWHRRPDQRATWLAQQGTIWRPEEHRNAGPALAGDRGWNNRVSPRNNSGIAAPRPVVQPRPAGDRDLGENRPAMPAATVNRSPDRGAFVGGESTREVRDFSNRGQESTRAVEHTEPAHTEPPRSEPVHSEPAHSEPAHVEAPASHTESSGGSRR